MKMNSISIDEVLGTVPVLTSQTGNCMTAANWCEAGINVASYYLAPLLMKPGFDFLSTLPDLASYVCWHGKLVLNASLFNLSEEGFYTLRSDYDGRRTQYADSQILELIASLKPDVVILPEGLWQKYQTVCESLPESIIPFLPFNDVTDGLVIKRPHGVYFSYDKITSPLSSVLQKRRQFKDLPCYVAGDMDLPTMMELSRDGIYMVESNQPAADACIGKIYCNEGVISLNESTFALQYELLDEHCSCPTCQQQLTRAYLHHLLEHTPQLCIRFLAQHNVYYCQQRCINFKNKGIDDDII